MGGNVPVSAMFVSFSGRVFLQEGEVKTRRRDLLGCKKGGTRGALVANSWSDEQLKP